MTVTLGTKAIVIADSGAADVLLPKTQIVRVGGYAPNNPTFTDFPARTHQRKLGGRLYIHMADGQKINILLEGVTNQATWVANNCNKTDVNTAIAAINTWL